MLGHENSLVDPQEPGLYNIEPGLVYDSSTEMNISMSFTIANGLSELIVEIPSHELGEIMSTAAETVENFNTNSYLLQYGLCEDLIQRDVRLPIQALLRYRYLQRKVY